MTHCQSSLLGTEFDQMMTKLMRINIAKFVISKEYET